MSSKPNVFTYATNELSQDAIICYMLEWAIKENESIDKEMHQVGKKFLSSLFEKCGKKLEDYETLEISKQEEKIDVLCIVDRKYHIIIEDKVFSSEHSNQLTRYVEDIKSRGIKDENILKLYYKTGEEYRKEDIESKGFALFEKKDILDIIPAQINNSIIAEYRSYIEQLQTNADYINQPIEKWDTSAWIKFVLEKVSKIEGINLGKSITTGKGQNSGIYFQYEKIASKGVAFYLRLAFEEEELQFKLENEGQQPTKDLGSNFYKLIDEVNKKVGGSLIVEEACKRGGKTMIVAKIKNAIESKADGKIDIDATKNRIEQTMRIHSNIIETLNI